MFLFFKNLPFPAALLSIILTLHLPLANADTLTLIGTNSKWGCIETESKTYLVRYFNPDRFRRIRFGKPLRGTRLNKQRAKQRLRQGKSRKLSSQKLARLRARVRRFDSILTDLKACKRGSPTPNFPGGSEQYPDACKIVGGTALDTSLLRIINGDTCTTGDSSTVLLQMSNVGSCTGTVVRAEEGFSAVITAAHCLPPATTSAIAVTGAGTVEASSFFAHPDFSSEQSIAETHDVGLVLFAEKLPTRITPVHSTHDFSLGELAYIGGFGLDEFDNSGVLKAAPVTLYSFTEHSIIIQYSGRGVWGNTCRGDSGGPLLIARDNAWRLAGITSNGDLFNCRPGDISRFTNITHPDNRSFINQHIPGLLP